MVVVVDKALLQICSLQHIMWVAKADDKVISVGVLLPLYP